jgi:hypothetical protein
MTGIEWHDFKTDPPTSGGQYLWAQNNWDATDEGGNPVLQYGVFSGYYRKRVTNYWTNESSEGIHDPDMWAEMPRPPRAKRPEISDTQKAINSLIETRDALDERISHLKETTR